ncbi:MAG: hypothetical protein Q4G48_05710 [Bacteroidia bacterium]|nr:hypothetical protein [Bacteroidia bacterium]
MAKAQNVALIKEPFVRNDTLILLQLSYGVGSEVEMQKAYVEPNWDSEIGKRLLSFSFAERDRAEYEKAIRNLKNQYPRVLGKHLLAQFPTHWLPLISFRDKYYVYDWEAYPRWFNDSVYVKYSQDGAVPYLIKSFEKKSNTHFQTRVIDAFSPCSDKIQIIDFYLIHPDNGIAVVRTTFCSDEEKTVSHQLMVALEKATNFDIIVWETQLDMPATEELIFDQIDFDKLVRDSKME